MSRSAAPGTASVTGIACRDGAGAWRVEVAVFRQRALEQVGEARARLADRIGRDDAADLPDLRQDRRRLRAATKEPEHHDHGGDHIGEEAVHRQQVGQPPVLIAELTRREHVDNRRLAGNRHHFSATDLPSTPVLRLAPVPEEVGGAALVIDVEQRTARHEQHHDGDVGLHDGGWNERRQLSKWIAREHLHPPTSAPDASSVCRMAHPTATDANLRSSPLSCAGQMRARACRRTEES